MTDLTGAALIREVHIYGQSLPVGGEQEGAAQHIGSAPGVITRHAASTTGNCIWSKKSPNSV